jgi:hypothetical protein
MILWTAQRTCMWYKVHSAAKLNCLKFICWEMKYGVLFSCSSDFFSYSFVEDFSLDLFEPTLLLQLFNFPVLEIRRELECCYYLFLSFSSIWCNKSSQNHPHTSSPFTNVTCRHLSLLDRWKIIFSTQSFENIHRNSSDYFRGRKILRSLLQCTCANFCMWSNNRLQPTL